MPIDQCNEECLSIMEPSSCTENMMAVETEVIDERLTDGAIVLEPREVYDRAVVGVDYQSGRAIYDMELVVKAGMKIHADYEESLDWHEHNTFSSYVGSMTPIFINPISHEVLCTSANKIIEQLQEDITRLKTAVRAASKYLNDQATDFWDVVHDDEVEE